MNILFTCAGRRNYLLRYFREALNGRGKIYAADMSSTAPALHEADESFTVPALADSSYVSSLLHLCKEKNVGLIISLNDVELPILSAHRAAFETVGTKLLVSSQQVVDICFDKLKTGEFLRDNGLFYPETYIELPAADLALQQGRVKFPLFVKPRWGSASLQIFRVDTLKELELAFQLAQIQLQKSFLKVDEKLASESILIQEGLPGSEYGIDILNDLNGNVRSVYVKKKLAMRAGETDKSELVDNPVLQVLGEKLGELVKHIGNLDCDVFYDGKTAAVLEMNPRFGGGYPFSHTLGANYPKAIVDWCSGVETDTSSFIKDTGRVISKCDTLIYLT